MPPALPPSPTPPTGLSRWIAHVLDSLIKIPGTKQRIGLDPIIGLIPGVGDAIASALGSVILLEAMRAGAPRILLIKMAGNFLINAIIGAVPVAGDLFSVWFRSNAKNYGLLKAWRNGGQAAPGDVPAKGAGLGCVILAILTGGICILAWWLFSLLWKLAVV